MTNVTTQPSVLTAQDIAAVNIDKLLRERGLRRKDLAAHLGKQPSVITRMLHNVHDWSLNDTAKVSNFVGASLDTLTNHVMSDDEVHSFVAMHPINRPDSGLTIDRPSAPVFSGPRYLVMPFSPDTDLRMPGKISLNVHYRPVVQPV